MVLTSLIQFCYYCSPELLQYHIMDEGICAAAIIGSTKLTTKEGQKIQLSCNARDSLVINGVSATDTDIVGSNGVIHVVDELLVPESGESEIIRKTHFTCTSFNSTF